MAKKFQNLSSYFNYVDKILEKCMKEVGVQLKNEMANYIFENPKQILEIIRDQNLIKVKV